MPEYERGDRKIHMTATKPDIRIIGYPARSLPDPDQLGITRVLPLRLQSGLWQSMRRGNPWTTMKCPYIEAIEFG